MRLDLTESMLADYTRSVLQVACKAIDNAGYEVEYIVPDGYGSIPKAERVGCHSDDLPFIVAYKDAVDLERQQREWDAAVPSAIAARRARRRHNQKHELGRIH